MNFKNNGEWAWRRPRMTVCGQIAFWDRQAATYAETDMTNDNKLEMDEVIQKCRQIPYDDIVTLGGAVGCRDPKVILDDLWEREPSARPTIFFNDLSPKQVEEAGRTALKAFAERGYGIICQAGEINTVCAEIAPRPRRLLIGIYDARSFFTAHKKNGHPKCGFDEYLGDSRILGEQFLFDWVTENEPHRLVSCGLRVVVDAKGNMRTNMRVKRMLHEVWSGIQKGRIRGVTALQVIGRTAGREGFFSSHWYTPQGFRHMLASVFPATDFRVTLKQVAKGTVFCVDPKRVAPTGVVTVLNNVIGNILPHQQYQTLLAIRGIVGK